MIITLEVTSSQSQILGDSATKVFDHNGGSFGRATHNAWVLPDESKTVSGQHGMVYFENGNFYLTDISTNGIFVNGSESPLGKGNIIALRNGDSLRFGEYEVKITTAIADHDPKAMSGQQSPAAENMAAEIPAGFASKPAAVPESAPASAAINDPPSDIESPDFDPLSASPEPIGNPAAAMGGIYRAGDELGNPFGASSHSDGSALPDSGYQHSAPIHDPFTSQGVSVDPALATPAGDNAANEIPEDWDLTGFSQPAVAASEAPVPEIGQQATPANCIPEDVSLFAEGEGEDPAPVAPQAEQPLAGKPPLPQMSAPPAAVPPAFQPTSAEPVASHSTSQTGIVDASYQAFMQGLGLPLSSLNPHQDPLQVMSATGRLFREVIQGLMILLQARTELKSQFRMSATTIKPTENNPLKFSPNVDEALKALFADERTGYLASDLALEEGIRDIRNHQMAMIAGMQSAFTALLQRLDPGQFSAEGKTGSAKSSLLSGGKNSRAWEQYCDYYDNMVVKSGNAFQLLFGEDFNAAYEEQLRILEASKQ